MRDEIRRNFFFFFFFFFFFLVPLLFDCCFFFKSNTRGRPVSVFTNILMNVEIEQILTFHLIFFFWSLCNVFSVRTTLRTYHESTMKCHPCALLRNISCPSWVVHGFFDHISVHITKNVVSLILWSCHIRYRQFS